MSQSQVLPEGMFTPFSIGSLQLKNRFVMPPMTRGFSPKGVPGQNVVDYYQRRAKGGIGLIVTEGTVVGHEGAPGNPDVPDLETPEAVAGWRRVVEAVHAEGGKIVPQLWHVGAVRRAGVGPVPEAPGYGPMPVVKNGKEVVVGMSKAEIGKVVDAFARAAAHARECGFDGLELHGAHGYLLDQFFFEKFNRRTDEYGGSLENRLRFPLEVIAAVRAAVGDDFPMILRYSQWKIGAYDDKMCPTPDDLKAFLTPLSEAGIDAFHASTRRHWEPEFDGSPMNLAGWTKKLTGKPVITVGSVGVDKQFLETYNPAWKGKTGGSEALDTVARLKEPFERGDFDLVAVGRSVIADPDWVHKMRDGRYEDIVPFSRAALDTLV